MGVRVFQPWCPPFVGGKCVLQALLREFIIFKWFDVVILVVRNALPLVLEVWVLLEVGGEESLASRHVIHGASTKLEQDDVYVRRPNLVAVVVDQLRNFDFLSPSRFMTRMAHNLVNPGRTCVLNLSVETRTADEIFNKRGSDKTQRSPGCGGTISQMRYESRGQRIRDSWHVNHICVCPNIKVKQVSAAIKEGTIWILQSQ